LCYKRKKVEDALRARFDRLACVTGSLVEFNYAAYVSVDPQGVAHMYSTCACISTDDSKQGMRPLPTTHSLEIMFFQNT
jgi:hypothetical protein